MIIYELSVLFRVMPKQELVAAVKRTANAIFDKGGVLRAIESMGTHNMPYKTSTHGLPYREASYFFMKFSAPPASISELKNEYMNDIDIIRRRIYKVEEPEPKECTLHEEHQPAPYRKDVQDLIAEARKLDKPKFQYNSGMDYYPFQK